MFKLFKKLKLLIHIVKFVKNPDSTDDILKASNCLITTEVFIPIIDHLGKDPAYLQLLQQKYQPQPVPLETLLTLPPDSLGFHYAQFMSKNNFDPNFYLTALHNPSDVTDQIAVIRLRARQVHDIWHVVTDFDRTFESEAGLQAFTFTQINSAFSALIIFLFFIHFLIYKRNDLGKFFKALVRGFQIGYQCKPVFGQKWEDNWAEPLSDVRRRLLISV